MPDAIIEVKLQPRASRNEIVGFKGNVLYIKVTAFPVEGEANSALLKLLSQKLDIAKSAITIIKGLKARYKIVKIQGMSHDEVKEKLSEKEMQN